MEVCDKPVIMAYMLPRFKVEMKITICDGEGSASSKKQKVRFTDIAPKEIKFPDKEKSFVETRDLFMSLIKGYNKKYNPHR